MVNDIMNPTTAFLNHRFQTIFCALISTSLTWLSLLEGIASILDTGILESILFSGNDSLEMDFSLLTFYTDALRK